MSIKNLFQQESDSVTEQPVRIPFDFSNRDSIPNGKDPGNSIVIKPITVRTWFRIRPLLLEIEKEDIDRMIVKKGELPEDFPKIMDKYGELLLDIVCLGIHNKPSDPPKWFKQALADNSTGKGKLSKRDGDRLGFPVFPLEWHDPKTGEVSSGYRESGYLPEAVVNFLALLGWNPGNDQEIMSMDELIELFSLEKCSKSGAKFDYEKGKWFNHKYIQEKSNEELTELFMPILEEKGIKADKSTVARIIGLVKGRVSFVKELWDQAAFFFVAPTTYEEKSVKKRWKEETPAQMRELIEILRNMDDFSSAPAEKVVLGWIEQNGYHLGNVMNAFRLAVVGECKGPHMFDITEIMGKEETIKRIERAIEYLG